MMAQVMSLEKLGHSKWERFVSNNRESTSFHSSSWHQMIEKSYQYKTHYHVILKKDGEIRSAIPSMTVRNLFLGKRTVCFPYSDH